MRSILVGPNPQARFFNDNSLLRNIACAKQDGLRRYFHPMVAFREPVPLLPGKVQLLLGKSIIAF